MQQAVEGLKPPILYDVAGAALNHEGKALLLARMEPGVPYIMSDVYQLFMSIQGPEPVWKLRRTGPDGYFETIANANVDLITQTSAGVNEARAHKITERGARLAKPLVGHLADRLLDEELSFVNFFGSTQTSSEALVSAAERRIKVMEILRHAAGEEVTPSELGTLLDTSIAQVGFVTDGLAAANVISKKSSGRGKPTVTFTPTPELEDVQLRSDSGQILIDVISALQRHYAPGQPVVPITNAEIAQLLIESYGYTEPKTALIKRVSRKTVYLADDKEVLQAKRQMDVDNARGTVYATSEQLQVIDGVLTILDGIQEPTEEYLAEGSQKINTILSKPSHVNHLLLKAMGNSSGIKTSEDEQLRIRKSLLRLIGNTQEPLSIRNIREVLLQSGDNWNNKALHHQMEILTGLGHVVMTETEEGFKYAHNKNS